MHGYPRMRTRSADGNVTRATARIRRLSSAPDQIEESVGVARDGRRAAPRAAPRRGVLLLFLFSSRLLKMPCPYEVLASDVPDDGTMSVGVLVCGSGAPLRTCDERGARGSSAGPSI